MGGIELAQQPVVHGAAGAVLAHLDLLGDDALLLLHGLRREIGGGDKVQQQAQVFFKHPRAVEIVRRHIGRGEGIGIGAVLSQKRQSVVTVRQIKHLVFQIMGYAGWGVVSDAIQCKAAVSPAVIGRKDRVKA